MYTILSPLLVTDNNVFSMDHCYFPLRSGQIANIQNNAILLTHMAPALPHTKRLI